jgi:DNA uptake protein ComE-like DNA-binding protein
VRRRGRHLAAGVIRGPQARRGAILLAVLVVISIAALAGVSVSHVAQADVQGAAVSQRRVQARALAWSGVQSVMAELAQQRIALLDGETPRITSEWEPFVDARGRRAVVRLAQQRGGSILVSEQGKVDINTAAPAMLSALGLDESTVEAIVESRRRRAFGSPGELLMVQGVTPEILYGASWHEAETGRERGLEAGDGLIAHLTVFSFDPNVQSGLGPAGSTHRARMRINVNTPWSERLGNAIDERFGEGAGQAARSFMTAGVTIDSLGVILRGAVANNLNRRSWPPLLDAFTVSDDPYIMGRVDLNVAEGRVLASIPGISPEAAEQMVRIREGLGPDARRSILWPLEENILTVEEMAVAADHLTTRSMQWRVVVEGGFIPSGDQRAWQDLEDETLQDRIVLEAVIDVASAQPRVAYLREVTLLPVARILTRDAMAVPPAGEVLEATAQDEQWPLAGAEVSDWRPREAERISEPPIEGPIEPVTVDGGVERDGRIGRWTPGPGRKGDGS